VGKLFQLIRIGDDDEIPGWRFFAEGDRQPASTMR
jgi:hypothetical protein